PTSDGASSSRLSGPRWPGPSRRARSKASGCARHSDAVLPTNAEMQARGRAFREELRKRGWAASVNAQFDERWTSDNMDLIRSAAANLVELNPDVIFASGARVIPILMELTRSIPIVTPSGSDLIERGTAGSLARPGGNVTGFGSIELSVIGKMLQT